MPISKIGGPNFSDSGTEGTKVASGTTAQRGSTTGQFRYNTTTNKFEGRNNTGSFVTLEVTPTVSSVDVTEVESAAGGNQTFVITGTNFSSGDIASFIGSDASTFNASSTTVDSSTQITAVAPKNSFANSKEPYDIKITSSGGLSGVLENQINVDNAPTFTTSAGSLGNIAIDETGNHFTIAATDPEGDSVTFSLQSGSLPTGTSISSAGVISGTVGGSASTYSFTIRATAGSKTADRAFTFITTNNPIVQTNLNYDWRAADYSGSAGTISSGTNVGSCFGSRVNNSVFSGNTVTSYGNITYTTNDSYAPSGKCFTFVGDGAVQIKANSTANYNTYFNSPSSYTWVMWIDWDDSTRQGFYSRYGSGGDVDNPNVYHFNHMMDSTTQFHYNQSGVNLAAANLSNGTWQNTSGGSQWQLIHIVYDHTSGNQVWYVDGNNYGTVSMGTNSGNGMTGYNDNETPHTLGGRTDDTQMLVGKIAEARTYRGTLTSTQVDDEWQATKGNYGR